jgi:hypothetical protein
VALNGEQSWVGQLPGCLSSLFRKTELLVLLSARVLYIFWIQVLWGYMFCRHGLPLRGFPFS